MSGRLVPLFRHQLMPAQQAMWDSLVQSPRGNRALRPEGYLTGPFDALLRSPELGAAAAQLGTVLRFQSSLEARLREMVIATVAAHWRARWAWFRHAEIAREAGVPEAQLAAIGAGESPAFPDPRDRVVHGFVTELLRTGSVDDVRYEAARQMLGEASLVDLVALIGYYSMESFVLNAFAVPLPEGAHAPWDPAAPGEP